jgi:RHS repeat-associated protein
LTPRERRWFTQPIWRQALSVLLITALVFTTTPTGVQAQSYNPVFYYYPQDHLGSSSVMTDRNGVVVEHYEYSAFGLQKCGGSGSAFPVSNRYTGQVADEETGLYYYGSRYYDPVLGRFIQPDTMVPDPSDSQQLNRYSYVNNNPLKYTDPTGHIAEWVIAAAVYILVSAAVGAATAAATGGDIGKGAVGGALSGAFSIIPYVGSVVGAVVTAAIYGDDIGMAALYASIGSVIGFAVGQIPIPNEWYGDLISGTLAAGTGALAGGITAEAMGGEFSEGATTGATSAAIGWAITQDLPDAYQNRLSDNPRFHLFMDALLLAIPNGWLENSANFTAGWADALTFGLTNKAREGYGINDVVNKESASYKGGIVVGAVHTTALQPAGASKNLGIVGVFAKNSGYRTITTIKGDAAVAKSIFRHYSKGEKVMQETVKGNVRRYTRSGAQIRFKADGTVRVELPGKGVGGRVESIHFTP